MSQPAAKGISTLSMAILIVGCSVDTDSTVSGYDFSQHVDFACHDARFRHEQYDAFFSDLPEDDRVSIEVELRETVRKCGNEVVIFWY